MPDLAITKIRTPDGVLHDFSTTHYITLPDDADYNVNYVIDDFTGSVELITGTTADYQLNVVSSTPEEILD